MPMLIEHIDFIARKEGRDVLFVRFVSERPPRGAGEEADDRYRDTDVDYETLPVRQQLIAWLESQGFGWRPCGPIASTNSMESYRGQIYIDVPYDVSLPAYAKLAAFLEHPDGSMRIPGVLFCYLPLEIAMKNAHHDAPGFWENWAENF